MFDKIKNLIWYDKQYLIVGKLYKLKREVGFNCGRPTTFVYVQKDTILLLINKEKAPYNQTKYTFLHDNKMIYHTNDIEYEKTFSELFLNIDENG